LSIADTTGVLGGMGIGMGDFPAAVGVLVAKGVGSIDGIVTGIGIAVEVHTSHYWVPGVQASWVGAVDQQLRISSQIGIAVADPALGRPLAIGSVGKDGDIAVPRDFEGAVFAIIGEAAGKDWVCPVDVIAQRVPIWPYDGRDRKNLRSGCQIIVLLNVVVPQFDLIYLPVTNRFSDFQV
jgi:hypothetical protein